jgi:hypothetical protein
MVKVKNIGTTTATGVKVRMTPTGASTPVTSKTFNITLSSVGGSSISDSVNVNLSSAQTITMDEARYYDSFGGYSLISGSTLSSTYGASVANVAPGQLYYLIVSFDISNTAPVTPVIDTQLATAVGSTTAMLNGEIIAGDDYSSAWFSYSSSDSSPECAGGGDTIATVSGTDFDMGDGLAKAVTGLSTSTTYYVRACGNYGGSMVSGDIVNFATTAGAPGPVGHVITGLEEVDIFKLPSIETKTFTLGGSGTVTLRGTCTSGPVSKVWFDLNDLTAGGTSSSTMKYPHTTCGDFDRLIPVPSSKFQYRACGENSDGMDCGAWILVEKDGGSTPTTPCY